MEHPTTTTETTTSRDERVGVLAYEIWEREGCPDGKAEEHWHLACTIIDAEDQDTESKQLPTWLARSEAEAPKAEIKQNDKIVHHPRHRSAA